MGKEKAAQMLYTMGELQYMVKTKVVVYIEIKKQAWELIIKKNLEIWGGGGGGGGVSREHTPTPSKSMLSWGQFHGNKSNLFIHTATDWNHLGDNQVKAHTL